LDKKNSAGIEVLIFRLPVVYGSGVGGNFKELIKFARRKIPLPVVTTYAKKSYLGIDNLISCIVHCLRKDVVPDKVYKISDDDDKTLSEVFFLLKKNMGMRYITFYLPEFFLKAIMVLFRKKELYAQIFIDSRLDVAESLRELGWVPKYSFSGNLKKMFKSNSFDLQPEK